MVRRAWRGRRNSYRTVITEMQVGRASIFLIAALLGSCASAGLPPEPPGQSAPDSGVAQAVIDSTTLRRPLHIVFAWTFTEQNARFSGQGAARVQPPYYARLDLFGPRGETYLAAAAAGDSLRLPPALNPAMRAVIPPVALLWSALGVLRAPEGAALDLTRQAGDTTVVGYSRGDERWRFRAVRGKLQYAEWNGPDAGRRTVELRGVGAQGLPAVAVYRDWAAFRELTLTLERANEVAAFPPETWQPGF
jgi:hypothetical protein